jgi:hypothetical protein
MGGFSPLSWQQVGIPIAHSFVHAVEASGAGVAIVSTVAATLGEVIATRALLRAQREKERAAVDAAAAAAIAAIDEAAGLARPRPEAAAAVGEPVYGREEAVAAQEPAGGAQERPGTCPAEEAWRWEEREPDSGGRARSGAAASGGWWSGIGGQDKLHKD